jgi:hypothetical protein
VALQTICRLSAIFWKSAKHAKKRSREVTGLVRRGIIYNNNPLGPIPLETIEWNCDKCGAAFPSMIKAREHENNCVVALRHKNSTLLVFTKNGMKLLGLFRRKTKQ